MKDLMVRCTNKNGNVVDAEYDTIMDFIEMVESNGIDISMMECDTVKADFFENPLLHKHFNTVAELYEHCKKIVL